MAAGGLSLTALKERLFELGVSTATPGLQGGARLEELARRLSIAEAAADLTSLESLSMSEIRTRLGELGESTSTPGLGECPQPSADPHSLSRG